MLRNPGHDPRAEQRQERLDELDADPRHSRREGASAQQDHPTHHLVVKARTGAGGAAEHHRALQERAVGGRHRPISEGSESGGDAVHHCAFPVENQDHQASRCHALRDRGIEAHCLAATGGPNHRIDGQGASIHIDHSASSLLDRASQGWYSEPKRKHVRYADVDLHPAPPPWPASEAWQPPLNWPPPPPAPWGYPGAYPPRRWPLAVLVIGGLLMGTVGVVGGAAISTAAAASTASQLAATGDYARAIALDDEIATRTGPQYLLDFKERQQAPATPPS